MKIRSWIGTCCVCRGKEQGEEWSGIDILVDIDATLVYMGRGVIEPPDVEETLQLHMRGGSWTYSLAHGALEFLAALDALDNVRVGLYSCGSDLRNRTLAKALVEAMNKKSYPFRQNLEAFSVPQGMYGKKILNGLRRGLVLEKAIMVDDSGNHVNPGEERNLLKIYERKFYRTLNDVGELYRARISNNLVRALGMILKALDMCKACGDHNLVRALQQLQWDSNNMYLHDLSNSKEIYEQGLRAMQAINPNFQFAYAVTAPWLSCQQDDAVFPRELRLILHRSIASF